MATLFEQGVQTIDREIGAAFIQAGVHNIRISHTTRGSGPADIAINVSAGDRTEELVFKREEIEDSARAIDSIAATNVRLLVSRFTG
jgi:hypothetical protein